MFSITQMILQTHWLSKVYIEMSFCRSFIVILGV